MQNPKVKKILSFIEKQKFNKAEILFKRIIKEYPSEENIKYVYFDALFRMKRFNNILSLIEKLKINSEDINILKLKALCYLEKNQPIKSIDYLQKVISHNPEPIIFNYLGVANAKIKNNDQARKFFLKSISLENNNITLVINYVNFLRDIYKNSEALELLKSEYSKYSNC